MSRSEASRPGALVISLDLELRWGVRDRLDGGAPYLKSLHGARLVVPRLLELFERFQIAATWATVGFLFAESREEIQRLAPSLKPTYADPRLSPYEEVLGHDEEEDPFHYAPSLIALIQRTPRQEIASHTFSHYYCSEAGQNREAFRADLDAACEIAARRGVPLRSIVFPRNQHNPDYDDLLIERGIRSYRGNPPSRCWRFSSGKDSRALWKRAGRLAKSYVGRARHGPVSWADIPRPSGLSDVRASFALRSSNPSVPILDSLRMRRLCRSLRFAAQTGRILHVWSHPHTFGEYPDENLEFLEELLQHFEDCRNRYGMLSLSMAEVDGLVRGEIEGAVLSNHGSQPSSTSSSRRT